MFTESYGLSELMLLVDDPSPTVGFEGNLFDKHFAPWPLRFYVLCDGAVVSFHTHFAIFVPNTVLM